MNLINKLSHLWAVALVVGVSQSLLAATPDAKLADAKAAAKEAAKEVVIPKAKFEYDNQKGKDPFFPKSVRWNPPPPKPVEVVVPGNPTQPVIPVAPKDPYKNFDLKGMTGVGNNRLVVINAGVKGKNYLLGLGESKSVVTPDGNYKIKVESFSEQGVMIKIEGEKAPKELKLPSGP